MRYTAFTIHFREGDSVSFKDEPKKIYDLQYPESGALMVNVCEGGHAMPDLPNGPMTLEQLRESLDEAAKAIGHEHKAVVMFAPGTWLRVEFS
jgi:hypothetical protein